MKVSISSVRIPMYILGPANREKSKGNDILVVAKPRPVAIYLAPPNVNDVTICLTVRKLNYVENTYRVTIDLC